MHFHIMKMYKDKEVKNIKDIFFGNVWRKNIFIIYVTEYGTALTFFLTFSSLYIFTIWKCIAYNRFSRDGIYFDKILILEYKLFKKSNKANLCRVIFVFYFILYLYILGINRLIYIRLSGRCCRSYNDYSWVLMRKEKTIICKTDRFMHLTNKTSLATPIHTEVTVPS